MIETTRYLLFGLGAALSMTGAIAALEAAGGDTPARGVRIDRKDPRFDALVPKDAVVEMLADGYAWTEGPVWEKAKARLLFSDIPGNRDHLVDGGQGCRGLPEAERVHGDRPLHRPRAGLERPRLRRPGTPRAVPARRPAHRAARGRREVHDPGRPLRGQAPQQPERPHPARRTATSCFTDPAYGLPKTFDDPARELPFTGVYRRTPDGTVILLVKDQSAPNGIALSPDDEDPLRGQLRSRSAPCGWPTRCAADGTVGAGRVFFDATAWVGPEKPGLPDGMKVDAAGNLFATGPGGLHVFAPDGTLLGTFDTGVPTANCAWGGDGSTLYITANTALLRVKTTTRGLGF